MELTDAKDLLFPSELDSSLTINQRFSAELRRKYQEMKSGQTEAYFNIENSEFDEKVEAIADFIRTHVETVGIEQAVKDIQTGLTCLCKGKSKPILEEKQPLEEDGDFGEKTYSALAHACEHYPLEIIFQYIQDGALTNAVFDTKDDKTIDTERLAQEICNDLNLED